MHFIISDLVWSISQNIQRCTGMHIYWFGSSARKKYMSNMDIDLLIINKSNIVRENFETSLKKMHYSLTSNEVPYSFCTFDHSVYVSIKDVVEKNQKYDSYNVIPKFIFGPLKTMSKKRQDITLHIKGPISDNEFILFCHYFPFHAKSIIYNHISFNSNHRLSCHGQFIEITETDYALWVNSLNSRVERSEDILEIQKCLSKLIYIYLVFNGIYRFDNKVIENLAGISCLSAGNKNVSGYKEHFRRKFQVLIQNRGEVNGLRACTVPE